MTGRRADTGVMGWRASDHETAVNGVLDALSHLGSPWTVLSRPRFGLERPDAVVLHPEHGVCSIVVTALRPSSATRHVDGKLISTSEEAYLADQPHFDARRIADYLYDSYYADVDGPTDRHDAVRSLLIAPSFDDATARATFVLPGEADADVARRVWGSGSADEIENALVGRVGAIAPPAARVDASGLQRVIDGAFLAPAPRPAGTPARINAVSRALVGEPAGCRFRRVRGPGGSGKTYALTARAAALAANGSRVCLLSFTTTLRERLSKLVRDRCAELGADPRLVTVTTFHELAEHTVLVAEAAGYPSVWPAGARWPVAIVDRARQVIDQGFDYRYDAILVDEGQDFEREWWEMLRGHYLAADGEMILTVDPTQNLYGVERWFDDETMASLGFAQPWIELDVPIRTPPDLVPALSVVGISAASSDGDATRRELLGSSPPSVRRWVDTDRVADLGRQIGREVIRLVRDHPSLAPSDIVFLCDYHHDGLAAVREIERAGIPVHHQFSRDPAGRGIRRRRFSDTSTAVKGATVHGFKGRETSALVMGVGADASSLALASIAIERVGAAPDGTAAIITVVNGDPGRRLAGASLRWDEDPAEVVMPTPAPTPSAAASPIPPMSPPTAPMTPATPPTAPTAPIVTPPAIPAPNTDSVMAPPAAPGRPATPVPAGAAFAAPGAALAAPAVGGPSASMPPPAPGGAPTAPMPPPPPSPSASPPASPSASPPPQGWDSPPA